MKRKRPGEEEDLPMDIAECKDSKQKLQAAVQSLSVCVSLNKIEPLALNGQTFSREYEVCTGRTDVASLTETVEEPGSVGGLPGRVAITLTLLGELG